MENKELEEIASSQKNFLSAKEAAAMSRGEYNQNKPRGLLHTLDSRIQTSNIGLVLPVVTRNSESIMTNGAVNMNYRRIYIKQLLCAWACKSTFIEQNIS